MKIPHRIHGIDKWKFDQRLNALTTLNHAMSIRFKAYGVSVVAQTVKRGWHSSRLLKADQYAAFAVFFLSTFLPYGQTGSFSLFGPAIAPAEHWHWFSKFRKRCLPAKPAEGPPTVLCDRATTLHALWLCRPDQYARYRVNFAQRPFAPYRNLWFHRFRPAASVLRGKNIERLYGVRNIVNLFELEYFFH